MSFKTISFLVKYPNIKSIILIAFLCLLYTSCITHKDLINFRSGEEKVPTLVNLSKHEILNQTDIKLQANDILGIIISSPDGQLAMPYNIISNPTGGGQMYSATSPTTYLINSEGFVDLPTLGKIKAAGLSVKEVREELMNRLSKDLVNPSVNVRLMNFKVSILGEVTIPSTIQVENERITILEALAKVGDLTPYSDRKHIMIIREKNGTREIGELDLKDTKFFTSPYYYLQQNDVVYVEPTKGKIARIQQPVTTYLQPVQVGISLLAILIAIFK